MASAPRVFDRSIAWVCRTFERDRKTELRVEREGMSRAEIVAAFPPHWNSNLDFNRLDLIKAIIYEAYREVVEDGKERDRDNIRGFWYERLMYTLIKVMGESGDDDNMNSISSTINTAWKELVEDGWVTYEALNLYSEKEDAYHIAVREGSPYPTAIIMVEKASLFEVLNDIADTYEVSFCCTGGQNSRAAAMAYATELEPKGVDLGQSFTVFSFTDFDPEGWNIPVAFIRHLGLRVTGDIQLVRLGMMKEQLGQSVIDHQAVPYPLDAKTQRARKAKLTKYGRFEHETGGLYIPNASGNLVPARVELNIYSTTQIRERIISGLAEHLEAFPYQVRALKESVKTEYDRALSELVDHVGNGVSAAYEQYFNAIDWERERLKVERAKRAPEARRRMVELQAEIEFLEGIIERETSDLNAQDAALSSLAEQLEDASWEEQQALVEYLRRCSDLPSPGDIIAYIEHNGGWRRWVDELGLSVAENRHLADDARQHRSFSWQLGWRERQEIRDWLKDKIEDAAPYLEPGGPGGPPEALIARALTEV